MGSFAEWKKHLGHTAKIGEQDDKKIVVRCSCGEVLESIDAPKTRMRIMQDDNPPDVRKEWDHLGHFVGWHGRYIIGDEQPTESPAEYRKSIPKGSVILPVFMLDHSGVSFSTGSFGDPWDSGQVGFIFMTPDKILEGWDTKKTGKITPTMRKKAKACLEAEIKEYDDYQNGRVWGYQIEFPDGTEDSCWGFIGEELEECGIIGHIPKECEALAEKAWDKRYDGEWVEEE